MEMYKRPIYSFKKWCEINGKAELTSFIKEYQSYVNETRKHNSEVDDKRLKANPKYGKSCLKGLKGE